eukprot:389476-Alexandrium_andersonii.AAC.1
MSASLVGSEMCIRDRCSSGYVGAPIAPLWPISLLGKRGSLLHGGSVAVSYTHLTLPTICSV